MPIVFPWRRCEIDRSIPRTGRPVIHGVARFLQTEVRTEMSFRWEGSPTNCCPEDLSRGTFNVYTHRRVLRVPQSRWRHARACNKLQTRSRAFPLRGRSSTPPSADVFSPAIRIGRGTTRLVSRRLFARAFEGDVVVQLRSSSSLSSLIHGSTEGRDEVTTRDSGSQANSLVTFHVLSLIPRTDDTSKPATTKPEDTSGHPVENTGSDGLRTTISS